MLLHPETKVCNGSSSAGLSKTIGRRKSNSWDCKLTETVIGEYVIVPLNSTRMLQSESYWMNNCCRDYADSCSQRSYTIFSIRRADGERVATLGLSSENESWCFDQCYGPSNSEVLEEVFEFFDDNGIAQTEYFPTELYYVAHEVVRLMNSVGNGAVQ